LDTGDIKNIGNTQGIMESFSESPEKPLLEKLTV
jgi:hypothetical protein